MQVYDVLLCVSLFCCGMLAFTFQNFYGCEESVSESLLMLLVDIYRFVATVALVVAFYIKDNTKLNLTDYKLVLGIFALGSIATFLLHIVKLSEIRSDGYCPLKNMDATEWQTELNKIVQGSCAAENNQNTETLKNPHVMKNSMAWCSERLKKRCTNGNFHYKSIMGCLRHGATDLVQHLQYIYVFDLAGDACRFVLFTMFALRESKNEGTKSKKSNRINL